MNKTESTLSYLKTKKDILYIIIGALIPVFPFFVFISYYQSLGIPFGCSYFGWWSECGLFAGVWLGAESIGVILIIKGLLLRAKRLKDKQSFQKPENHSNIKKRSTRSNPLM